MTTAIASRTDATPLGVEVPTAATVERSRLLELEARLAHLEQLMQAAQRSQDRFNLLVFEGTRDRLLAAFVLANGAAACGMQVTMFFSFWGTTALRKRVASAPRKSWVECLLGWMLPRTASHTRLSQLDLCGAGRWLLRREMLKKNIADLPALMASAAELGVRLRVCEMSMKLLGIDRSELIDYPHMEFCGVAQFIDDAAHSHTNLFI